MRKNLLLIAVLILVACAPQEARGAQNHIEFDPTVYYSQLIINSNLYHFHCNTGKVGGLGRYDASTGTVSTGEYVSSRKFDYVNGLVFKATLEAIQQHYNTEGIEEDAFSWFKSVEEFGNRYYNDSRDGKSLDDLNACKLYFGLYDITKSGGVCGASYENSTTASNCTTAKTKALAGLNTHNSSYSISSAVSNAFSGDESYTGGWFHKDTYKNQLWLDGQYMGPALLAMMIADGRYISGSAAGDWAIIRKQFDMCWNRLWDSEMKLLYHAFSADPTNAQNNSEANYWADQTGTYATNPHYGASSEFWGRAAGWYFFALVDILEQMDKIGKNGSDPDYVEFKRQLEAVADGLLNCEGRDAATGCWCQLLQYPKGHVPEGCSTANYLESSASAIFTATFLKGIRLGYLSRSKYEAAAKKAYKGFVEQFIVENTDGEDSGNAYSIINCCASAGLDNGRNGSAAYYLADVGDKDTKKITTYTEGKVLGAFILAATEYERAYPPAAAAAALAGGECRCLRVSVSE